MTEPPDPFQHPSSPPGDGTPPPPGYGPPPPGYGPPPGGGPPPGYGPPPAGWGQPQYGGYPPASRGTNTLAIIAFVAAFVCSPVAIILGFIARGQIKESGEGGNGLALAAIIIGGLSLLVGILAIAAGALVTNSSSGY